MDIFKKIQKLLEDGKAEEANKLFMEHMASGTEALESKRDELLASLRKEKDSKNEIMERLNALEDEKAKIKEDNLDKEGDIKKIKEALEEKFQKKIDDLTTAKEAEIATLTGHLNTHIVEGGLASALTKAGVKPELMDAATALIKSKFGGEIGDNDGTPFAKFDGKVVDEFVTDWSKSDAGKHFVVAQNNSGGGSNGANDGGNAAGAKTITRTDFDAMGQAERMSTLKDGVKVVNQT